VAILKLARRLGGRLTVADVVLGTGLSLGEAEATLNELARHRYVDLQVSPSGVLVYHCFPLAHARDKSRAERVMS
jgi:DNA-binding IclR family transcriptional regulator